MRAERFVPTILDASVNRRVLFAREAMANVFRTERIPSSFPWRLRRAPAGIRPDPAHTIIGDRA